MSSRFPLLDEDALKGAVVLGVVGGLVLPAVPDDVQPGAGQDACGVGVVVAACSGSGVEVGGPGVGVSGVGGEVDHGVAQLFVTGPAESDGAQFAGLAGRGCYAGQAGQRFGGGELGAAVADLGQKPRGSDAAAAGQAGEDVGVCVCSELLVDLGRECLDLLDQGSQQGDVAGGDRGLADGVATGGAAGGVLQALVQRGGVGAAGVALGGQPVAQAFGREPVDAVWVSNLVRKAKEMSESRSLNRPMTPGRTLRR